MRSKRTREQMFQAGLCWITAGLAAEEEKVPDLYKEGDIEDKWDKLIEALEADPKTYPDNMLPGYLLEGCKICHEGVKEIGYRLEDVSFYPGFAEPGYTQPKRGVAMGNWNTGTKYNQETREFDVLDDTVNVLGFLLENMGCDCVFDDEYTACSNCYKLIRTSPDSYGWEPSFLQVNDDIVCHDCLTPSDMEEWLESSADGKNVLVNTGIIQPEDFGYEQVTERLANGFYGGQDDDPRVIIKSMKAKGIKRFIFVSDGVGQFDVRFSVWLHESEKEKFHSLSDEERRGPDPAEMMKKALSSNPVSGSTPDGGVAICHVNVDDGTTTTEYLTPDEFVNGKGKK